MMILIGQFSFSSRAPAQFIRLLSLAVPRGYPRVFMIIMVVHLL
jgi:hypothetical protein